MGTENDWTREVAGVARQQAKRLGWDSTILNSDDVSISLGPLRGYFTGYAIYALVIPAGRTWSSDDPDDAASQFFREFAIYSKSDGLVLMPSSAPRTLTEIVDPFPALRALAEKPVALPAAVFWTSHESACVLPLQEVREFGRKVFLALETAREFAEPIIDRLIREEAREARLKRLFHLSDLHFGRPEASRRRSWLKEHLAGELGKDDQVVITGDLFDNPKESLRVSFDEFRKDIENMTGKTLMVIPGNHDVRAKGNVIGRIGRNDQHIADLDWKSVVFDDNLQIIFFSFNSSESGNWARGSVSERQRLNCATAFETEKRRRSEVEGFIRVALVHHHPLAYDGEPTTLLEKVLDRFGGQERFIAAEGAEEFLNWCAARQVSLVLHGHKHVPRWVTVQRAHRGSVKEITVVGCGSTTGVEGKPMCYDIVALDPSTKRWNVLFYHDEVGDGSGFGLQTVAVDLR